MNFVPYLRFLLAIWIGYSFIKYISKPATESFIIFSNILMGVVVFTFTLYCLLVGAQELTKEKFIQARFFSIFGIVFQIVLFLIGIYTMVQLLRFGLILDPTLLWFTAVWGILVSCGLLKLIFVDIKAIVKAEPE